MDDFLHLDIPLFRVMYKKRIKYGYSKANEKKNTKTVLSNASGGYCMYCYTRVAIDRKNFGDLEHAIEKKNSEKLIECIPNIGMACSDCNQSFKKVGDRRRRISESVKKNFEERSKCTVEKRKQCTVPCKALRDLQKEYSKMPGAEIILQPMGIIGGQSGNPLNIQYDVLKMEFQPNTNLFTYSEDEIEFINKHIQRFRLNDPKYMTYKLADYIKNLIDSGGVSCSCKYDNMIVELFDKKLKGKTAEERVDICSKIYTVIFPRINGTIKAL